MAADLRFMGSKLLFEDGLLAMDAQCCCTDEPPFLDCGEFIDFLHFLGGDLTITLFVPCGATETVTGFTEDPGYEGGQRIDFHAVTLTATWRVGFTCNSNIGSLVITKKNLLGTVQVYYGAGTAGGFTNGDPRTIPEISDPGFGDCNTIDLTLEW